MSTINKVNSDSKAFSERRPISSGDSDKLTIANRYRTKSASKRGVVRKIDKKGRYLRNILRHTDEVQSGVYQMCSTQLDSDYQEREVTNW